MLPLIQVGPLTLQTPGLVLLLALWIGLWLMERAARRSGVNPDPLYNLALAVLLFGLAGARLTYAAESIGAFLANPLALLSPNPAMFNLSGGILAAILAGLVYAQRHQLPLWTTLDALTPALAVLAVGIGAAHLAAGSGFGAPTRLPWGIELWGETRHPSQVYEILTALVIAGLVWPKTGRGQPAGLRFLAFLALSAGARIFLETFRGDSILLAGTVRSAQAAAWVVLLATLGIISKRLKTEEDSHGSDFH